MSVSRRIFAITVLALAALSAAAPAAIAKPPVPASTEINDGLYANGAYSEAADPEADLARAVQTASAANKRILIEVGGDWCVWCHILDAYLNNDKKVRAEFLKSFVIVRVNFSPEHKNEGFLGKFPARAGYPHFFVLEKDGKLLTSQDTGKLEKGDSYNRDKMLKFAKAWRP